MAPPIRILIPLDSQEAETVNFALGYAQEIAKLAKSKEVILLTHSRDQLRHTPLAEHIGPGIAKTLTSGRSVSLSSGVLIRHETMKTLRYLSSNPVIIAYYANEKLLEFVDSLSGFSGTVAVPWVPGEAALWCERWTPIVHGQGKQAETPILDDPVVVAALTSLSSLANLSHSLLKARDKEWAEDILRILRAHGHALDAIKIKNWAMRHGWKPGAADDLAKLAQKIGGLKTKPRLTGIHDPNGRYARWKSGND